MSQAIVIDPPHKSFVCLFQIISGITLVVQWRTGNPWMFVARGLSSWVQAAIMSHDTACGKVWVWEPCNTSGWDDYRQVFRLTSTALVVRNILNGCSLLCQCHWPHVMFLGHGNVQLFLRGAVQSTGIVFHLVSFSFKESYRNTDKMARDLDYQLSIHILRVVLVAIASWSLIHQWWYTGAGNTGHPVSDMHERFRLAGHSSLEAMRKALSSAKEKVSHASIGAIQRLHSHLSHSSHDGGDSNHHRQDEHTTFGKSHDGDGVVVKTCAGDEDAVKTCDGKEENVADTASISIRALSDGIIVHL